MRPACTGGSPAGHLWGFTRPGAPGPLRLARPSSVPHFVLQPQAPPSQAQPALPTDPSVPNLACSRVLRSSCKPVVHSTGPSPSSAEPSLLSVPHLRACSLQACPQSTQAQDRGQGRSQPLASGRPSAPTRCPEACPPPSWVGRGPAACEGRAWTAGVLSRQRAELPVPGPVRAAPRPGGRAGQRAPGVRGQRQQHTQRRRHAHLRGKAGCTAPPPTPPQEGPDVRLRRCPRLGVGHRRVPVGELGPAVHRGADQQVLRSPGGPAVRGHPVPPLRRPSQVSPASHHGAYDHADQAGLPEPRPDPQVPVGGGNTRQESGFGGDPVPEPGLSVSVHCRHSPPPTFPSSSLTSRVGGAPPQNPWPREGVRLQLTG